MTRAAAWIATAVSTIALTTTTADANPAWCSQVSGPTDRDIEVATKGTDPADVLTHLVGLSCTTAADRRGKDNEIEAARQRWNARLDLTEADWAKDVVPWAMTSIGLRGMPMLGYDEKQAPSAMDAISQYAFISKASYTAKYDPLYAADMFGTKLSQLGRLAVIELCTKSAKPIDWVLCQSDIEAFDRKALGAEIRADKTERAFHRMVLRIKADQIAGKLTAHATKVQQITAKDEAYPKLFALAKDAHKDWKSSPPDATALALALAMDDANQTESTKARAGCDDAALEAFSKVIAATPASSFKELKPDTQIQRTVGILLNDKSGYLAGVALYTCRQKHKDVLDRMIGTSLVRWPGHRGPRSSGLTAIIAADLKLDDASEKIELPALFRRRFESDASFGGGGRGAVAKVKASGDKTDIEFVKKLQKVKVCTSWKDSGRIEQVLGNGTVIYASTCLKYGMDTIDNASQPVTVDTKYATGVKAGVTAYTVENVVVSVQTKADAAPSHIFGVAVK